MRKVPLSCSPLFSNPSWNTAIHSVTPGVGGHCEISLSTSNCILLICLLELLYIVFTILILGKPPDQNHIEIKQNLQRKYIVWRIEGYVSILGKDLNTGTYRYINIFVQSYSMHN
jgi:hypothetical protein